MSPPLTIHLGTILQDLVGHRNLVSREVGHRVRDTVEAQILGLPEETIVLLDFSGVDIVDFTGADECVQKLMSRLCQGEYGQLYVVLQHTTPTQEHNLVLALERRRVVVWLIDATMALRQLGDLNPWVQRVLDYVMAHPGATARSCANALGLNPGDVSAALGVCYKAHLLRRSNVRLEAGGREFVYTPLL
jgi:hypothetical protein